MLIALALGAASIVPADAEAPCSNRSIRIVVPFGPGGFADITVRLLAQKLTERTNAQMVIENRPGAGGITAANTVVSAAPDGYALFVFSSGIALARTSSSKSNCAMVEIGANAVSGSNGRDFSSDFDSHHRPAGRCHSRRDRARKDSWRDRPRSLFRR